MEYLFQGNYIASLATLGPFQGFSTDALCHPRDKPSILDPRKAHHTQSLQWKFELISQAVI